VVSITVCYCSPEPFRNSTANGVGNGVGDGLHAITQSPCSDAAAQLWNSGTLLSLFVLGSGSG